MEWNRADRGLTEPRRTAQPHSLLLAPPLATHSTWVQRLVHSLWTYSAQTTVSVSQDSTCQMFPCSPVAAEKLPILLIFVLVTLAQNEIQDPPNKIQGEPTLLGDHGAPHSCLEIVQLLAYKLVAVCLSPTPTKKKKGGKNFHSFIYSFLVNTALEGIPTLG